MKDSVQPSKNTAVSSADKDPVMTEKTAAQTFLEFAKMNPAERMRAAYLKDKGLSEEDLAALPKEEREKIEEEIRQMIEKKVRQGLPDEGGGLDMKV